MQPDVDDGSLRGTVKSFRWASADTVDVTVDHVVGRPGVEYSGNNVPVVETPGLTGTTWDQMSWDLEDEEWVYFTVDAAGAITSIGRTHQEMGPPSEIDDVQILHGTVVFVAEHARDRTMSIKVHQDIDSLDANDAEYVGQGLPLVEYLKSNDPVRFTVDKNRNIIWLERPSQ